MPIYLLLSIFILILFSGLFSGLTIGLFSLDKTELERKAELKDADARKVLAVRRQGNLLLVALLLGNVAVNSAISILLTDIASGVIAGIIATGLIVIFGEIIPQATCARYAMKVGAQTAWLVKIVIAILYPIAKPIAWILDKILGEELRTIWSKRELEHIIKMHEDDPRSAVDEDEERILLGALRFSDRSAEQVMTVKKDIYMLQKSTKLDQARLHEIREEGYTRVPVFSGNKSNILGILYAKDLIGLTGVRKIEDMMRTAEMIRVSRKRKLDSILDMMIKKHGHMALVTEKNGNLVGIVTLEDLLEEIIGQEIEDEDDV